MCPACFSLVELLIVLLVVAMALTLVLPRVGYVPRGVAVRSMLDSFRRPFQDASIASRAGGRPVTLVVNTEENLCRLERDTGGADEYALSAQRGSATPEAARRQKSESPFALKLQTYELSDNIRWQNVEESAAEHRLAGGTVVYTFLPSGEAFGPDLTFSYRDLQFRLALEPLTGRVVFSEQDDNR